MASAVVRASAPLVAASLAKTRPQARVHAPVGVSRFSPSLGTSASATKLVTGDPSLHSVSTHDVSAPLPFISPSGIQPLLPTKTDLLLHQHWPGSSHEACYKRAVTLRLLARPDGTKGDGTPFSGQMRRAIQKTGWLETRAYWNDTGVSPSTILEADSAFLQQKHKLTGAAIVVLAEPLLQMLQQTTTGNEALSSAISRQRTSVTSSGQQPDNAETNRDLDAEGILNLLPHSMKHAVRARMLERAGDRLVEVQLDVGKPPCLRFRGSNKAEYLDHLLPADMQEALQALQSANMPNEDLHQWNMPRGSVYAQPSRAGRAPDGLFGPDNRVGVPGTLHRISAMRTRDCSISGLTYRVGRHTPGASASIKDVLQQIVDGLTLPLESSLKPAVGPAQPCQSLLVVGRPGLGKTTLLRDVACFLAEHLAVVVVDSSMDIGGAAVVPHLALGKARRMEVPDRRQQHDVMIEAVQNHAPQVIVVDEVGTREEVAAVKSITERGIAMVATAHGTDLASLLDNPTLNPLLGGVQSVMLGDVAATSNGGYKMKRERAGIPAFTTLVEIVAPGTFRLYLNLMESVDSLLRAESRARCATAASYMRIVQSGSELRYSTNETTEAQLEKPDS